MSNGDPISIVVVDDSIVYRSVIRDVLSEIPDARVVGVAADGHAALAKVKQLQPDLLTLDLEMPLLDGLGVLQELQQMKANTAAIMLSSFTERGADATAKALRFGAFDFVRKPASENQSDSRDLLKRELSTKLKAFKQSRFRCPKSEESTPSPVDTATVPTSVVTTVDAPAEVVAIGISTGGPAALAAMLPKVPIGFHLPIVIVQHMPPMFTKSLADDLDRICPLKVSEAANGQQLRGGEVLIAPGGKQMKVTRTDTGDVIRLADDPPEKNCRPSVDYLFRSLADGFGPSVLAVMMTGMGDDGALGCRLLKRKGAKLICQDEASCTVFGMPRKPIEERLADCVTPLDGIARQISRLARRGAALCP